MGIVPHPAGCCRDPRMLQCTDRWTDALIQNGPWFLFAMSTWQRPHEGHGHERTPSKGLHLAGAQSRTKGASFAHGGPCAAGSPVTGSGCTGHGPPCVSGTPSGSLQSHLCDHTRDAQMPMFPPKQSCHPGAQNLLGVWEPTARSAQPFRCRRNSPHLPWDSLGSRAKSSPSTWDTVVLTDTASI